MLKTPKLKSSAGLPGGEGGIECRKASQVRSVKKKLLEIQMSYNPTIIQ